MELMGIEPMSIQNFLIYSFTGLVTKNNYNIRISLNYNKYKYLQVVNKLI